MKKRQMESKTKVILSGNHCYQISWMSYVNEKNMTWINSLLRHWFYTNKVNVKISKNVYDFLKNICHASSLVL